MLVSSILYILSLLLFLFFEYLGYKQHPIFWRRLIKSKPHKFAMLCFYANTFWGRDFFAYLFNIGDILSLLISFLIVSFILTSFRLYYNRKKHCIWV